MSGAPPEAPGFQPCRIDIFGIGFPAWTGGAMQFIYSEGSERFVANAEALVAQHGERFALDAKVRDCIARHAP